MESSSSSVAVNDINSGRIGTVGIGLGLPHEEIGHRPRPRHPTEKESRNTLGEIGTSSITTSDNTDSEPVDKMNVDEIARVQPLSNSESYEDAEEIMLSVFWRRGMLGAAYYIIESSEVYLLTDIVDINPEFNMLKSLFHQVQPSQVLTISSMTELFVTTLRSLVCSEETKDGGSSSHEEDMFQPRKKLHMLPGKEYFYESCKRRVLTLKLPSEPENANEEEHLMYINSLVTMSAESMVHAFGALLKWLDKSWALLNLEPVGAQTAPRILAIHTLSLDDIVTIDSETYEALQIFSQQSHPSNFKMWTPGSSREGLSVFGLFNRCKSCIGSKFMKVLFLHPTRNIDVLNARLDVINFCCQPKNEEIVKSLLDCLKSIKSVTTIITKLSAANVPASQWKTLHKTIYNVLLIAELCAANADKAPLFQKIGECLSYNLHHVAHCIHHIVDFEASEAQNKFVVRLGVHEQLDRDKQRIGCLGELMSGLVKTELEKLPLYVKNCSMVHIPEIGFLLSIPKWKQMDAMNQEDTYLPGLTFMFELGGKDHYKSDKCKALDVEEGGISLRITDQEARIMVRLVQFVELHLGPLVDVLRLIAELDCLIALSAVARENNFVRPTLTVDRVLDIKDGRHPLQEMCVDSFVPNDTLSSEEHGLMKILTGPNASGKSVYLKQVALIAYLAHIGSFVPATSATIGILDHIHTRIQTIESIAARLSAFMIDTKQMALALMCSSPTSLIIVDEYGKGTSDVDGLALLAASLQNFLDRGNNCPHVFVSTHFHHVGLFLPQSEYLQMQTLDHLVDRDGQVVYLFKLKTGQVKSSFAIKVAETVGISQGIVNRAQVVLNSLEIDQPVPELPNCKRSIQLDK